MAAKLAIADALGLPLGRLPEEQRAWIDALLRETLDKPITAEVVGTVLSRQLDELEPRLTRDGYNVKSLAMQFHTKPAEIRRFLRGALNEQRTHELTEQMRAAGLPL